MCVPHHWLLNSIGLGLDPKIYSIICELVVIKSDVLKEVMVSISIVLY